MAFSAKGNAIIDIENSFRVGFHWMYMMSLYVARARFFTCHANIVVSFIDSFSPFYIFKLPMNDFSPFINSVWIPLWIKMLPKATFETLRDFLFGFFGKNGSIAGMFVSNSLFCVFTENPSLSFGKRFAFIPSAKFPCFISYWYSIFEQKFGDAYLTTADFFCDLVNAFFLFAVKSYELFFRWFNGHLRFSSQSGWYAVSPKPITYSGSTLLVKNFCHLHSRHFLDHIHIVQLFFLWNHKISLVLMQCRNYTKWRIKCQEQKTAK